MTVATAPIDIARATLASAATHINRRALSRCTIRRDFLKPDAAKRLQAAAVKDRALLRQLAKAVRFLRVLYGLRQPALAATCGCSFKQISNIERAQNWPSPALHGRICRAFGVEV